MGSIFLSYAGTDREIASRIYAGLTAAGIDVWWDREGIGWGDNWVVRLEDELEKCSAYVVLIGQSGIRKWVKAELYLAITRHFEQNLPIFPMLLPNVTVESLPPFLKSFQAQTLPQDLGTIDYSAMAQQLASVLGAPESERAAIPSDVCPFPGLESFGEKDVQFFFGRQKDTLDAVSRLGVGIDGVYRRWLHIEGTSGVGKSSLVQAGIVPAIKAGWAGSESRTWSHWRVLDSVRPGNDPILNLAEVLSRGLGADDRRPSVHDLDRTLRDDDRGLQILFREWLKPDEALVLIVDQLEEIFSLVDDAKERSRFDVLLANALQDQDGCLHLITTIRSDFMMRFNELPCLQRLLTDPGRFFLKPIDEHGLKDVVYTPARLAGLHWSDESLPEDMIGEVHAEPGALPLIENALRLMWLGLRSRQDNELSRRQLYDELGGVGGALAKSADALLESLGKRKQNALNLLVALVNVGGESQDTRDTRRTISKVTALRSLGGGKDAEDTLNQLSGLRGPETGRGLPPRPRLIVVGDGNVVDLAHETLLRNNRDKKPFWPALRNEITKQRKLIENRELAEALAKDWVRQGSSRSFGLASRAQRKAFRHLRGLSEEAQAYVESSVRFFARLKWSVALVIVLSVSFYSLGQWAKSRNMEPFYAVYIIPKTVSKVLLGKIYPDIFLPQMEPLPRGAFMMGYVRGGEEVPEELRTNVKIDRRVAIGKYEVTYDDYDVFALATGRALPSDNGWGRGQRPVIRVTWFDASEYATWLSRKTGKQFRLPSEAEWEYAARSGGKEQIWAGTSDEKTLMDYAIFSQRRTEEVGKRKPNDLKLHDMSGNVWEWLEDCWHRDYNGAPTDGRAWGQENGGDCGRRVIRGGSWDDFPGGLRSSIRYDSEVDNWSDSVGFRLAQDNVNARR